MKKGIEGEIDGPVGGEAFELAQGGGPRRGLEEMHGDVGVGNVINGRMAFLENAEGTRSFGEKDAAVDDADVVVNQLEAGWARIFPCGLGERRGDGCSHGRTFRRGNQVMQLGLG